MLPEYASMYVRKYAYICPARPTRVRKVNPSGCCELHLDASFPPPFSLEATAVAVAVAVVVHVRPAAASCTWTRPSHLRSRLKPPPPSSSFMCGLLLLLLMDQPPNDWDLQAVVRSCGSLSHPGGGGATGTEAPRVRPPSTGVVRGSARAKDAAALYDLEYLDLDHKPFSLATPSQAWAAADDGHEVMISFPAAVASTSGPRPSPGRKPVLRTSRPKRSKKNQLKKVVREVPVSDGAVSSDLWAWRKYGQKPIKGSPYPRGYYKCSSMKGCIARKMVERSVAKPGVLIITYMAEHCHPVPTQINALAGTTRQRTTGAAPAEDHPTTSPTSHGKAAGEVKREDGSNESPPSVVLMPVDGSTAAADDDENELWLAGMDDFFAPDFDHVLEEEDGILERRLSL